MPHEDTAAPLEVDVAIIGAGTGGMAAYREARKHTDRIALIDGGPLGTTCARVGCMPSKLLIAAAEARHRAQDVAGFGLVGGEVGVDGPAVMRRVREERDRFVGFVLEAVHGFDEAHLIRRHARFEDDRTLILDDGRRVRARAVVIATGSRPSVPAPFEVAGDRLIVSDDVFEWQDLPESVAVIGAGVIGLELGQALHRLGVRTHLFGRGGSVGPLSDPEVLERARGIFAEEMPVSWNAETTVGRDGDDVTVAWKDAHGSGEARFDYLLAATGRRANVDSLGLGNTSLSLDGRGVPEHDPLSMRCGTSAIFILGAEMIGPAAEHIGHLLAWTIDDRLTVSEALGRPFYHPVIEEGVRTALRTLNARLGFDANPPARCIDCGPGG